MTAASGKKVRVRLAPSPTGPLHIGTARTALFNWLFARQYGGVFVLRVEDTDKARSEAKFEKEALDGLKWLGLEWDEGPYRQSERTDIYKRYAEKLLAEKKAYYCYCTKDELEAERQVMLSQGLSPKYGGHCKNLKEPPPSKVPQVIRFKTPEVKVEFKDIIRGKVSFDATLFGDIAIGKDLETPLYNFAVVVDDHEMKITHVIRGEDHLSNTPKQILFQRALGFDEPEYAHLPLILNPDRSKMSKRFADTALSEYMNRGYLPEAITNFLALLGWHPQDDRELFKLNELIGVFDLKRVQKAGAVFNQEKLDWLQKEYLKQLSTEEMAERIAPIFEKEKIPFDEAFLKRVIGVERSRLTTLSDFAKVAGFFFTLSDYDPKLLLWQGGGAPETTKRILEASRNIIEEQSMLDRDSLAKAFADLTDKEGRGPVLWPLRVALSGLAASPDPMEIIEVFGKEESLSRIENAITKISRLIDAK